MQPGKQTRRIAIATGWRLIPGVLLCITACDRGAPTIDALQLNNASPSAISRAGMPQIWDYAIEGGAIWLAPAKDGVLAITPTDPYLANDVGISPLALVAFDDSDATWGNILATAQRDDGLMLVATDKGLFTLEGWGLIPSPLSQELLPLGVHTLTFGSNERWEDLWIGAETGLYRVSEGMLSEVVIDDTNTQPSAIAAVDDTIVIAYPKAIYELNVTAMGVTRLDLEIGLVHGVAAGAGLVWIAADAGLYRRDIDGSYTLFTLGLDGGSPVLGVTCHGSTAYAITTDAIIRVAQKSPELLASTDTPLSALAADPWGNVWYGGNAGVYSLRIGDVVGFDADLRPFLESTCNGCHVSGYGAPLRDFGDYDVVRALSDAVLDRVATGLMPPPPIPALTQEQVNLLVRWNETGQAP